MSLPSGGWRHLVLSPWGGALGFAVGFGVLLVLGGTVMRGIVAPICAQIQALETVRTCDLTFTSPGEMISIYLRQAVLVGGIVAIPALFFQSARIFAPTLFHHAPTSVAVYALAGGIVACLGAIFVFLYEGPRSVEAALGYLNETMPGLAMSGFALDYLRAVLRMAVAYVLLLQLPLIFAMMVKSMRTRRIMKAEVQT